MAGVIAEQLDARLSGSEKQELAAKPTQNADAYNAFLRGLALYERPDLADSDLREAITSFETAVKLTHPRLYSAVDRAWPPIGGRWAGRSAHAVLPRV